VIGPVLMNLFMTYAFDKWMDREHPNNPFSRYADDAVAHCRSEAEAKKLLAAIEERLKECKLELHPDKSGIVYCKDSSRRKDYPKVSFTFLGYEFRPRSSKTRDGKFRTNFLPAISASANEADQARDSRVEPSETNLCQLERAGQAIQSPHQGLDELLQPLLQVRTVSALRAYR
jgi:RNA-directed DNA polymerase